MDLGFENAGFDVGLALDRNADGITSYNKNRIEGRGFVKDICEVDLAVLDSLHGKPFNPRGVIGGPPCQSFSQANLHQFGDDPRHRLPVVYANLLRNLNERSPVDFFVLENVVGMTQARHRPAFEKIKRAFGDAGFYVVSAILNASEFSVPQTRERLFLVGFNKKTLPGLKWVAPKGSSPRKTVRDVIGHLGQPAYFSRQLRPTDIPCHPNHWCMNPKSRKFFTPGALSPGKRKNRSFKTLEWDQPSITVAYGHREVHIHPTATRRLSVYEGMLLQGFPPEYVLTGTLSSQINQVSEAVPPPLAEAVAKSVLQQIEQFRATELSKVA